jgi:hypothetical protein
MGWRQGGQVRQHRFHRVQRHRCLVGCRARDLGGVDAEGSVEGEGGRDGRRLHRRRCGGRRRVPRAKVGHGFGVPGRGGSAGGDAGLTIGQGANDHGFHEVFGVHRVPRPRECRGRVLAVEIEHDFGAAWVSGNSLRGLDFSDRGGQEYSIEMYRF